MRILSHGWIKHFAWPRALRIGKSIHRGIRGFVAGSAFLVCIMLSASIASAQAMATGNSSKNGMSWPDAPQLSDAADPSQASVQNGPGETASQQSAGEQPPQQTKRILGIVPNFRSVSADVKLPPQSVKDKFMSATDDSFDYSSVFIPAMLAVYSLGTNADPEFGHGGVGYARYLWHAAVDQTSENYMVEFIVPAITHEDNRYYTLGHGGFLKRTGYALSRAVITRNDGGRETFNFSEVVGAGASSGLSSLYYPTRERSLANTGQEWGLDVGIDAASFVVKEFWPDVNRRLFHRADAIQGDER